MRWYIFQTDEITKKMLDILQVELSIEQIKILNPITPSPKLDPKNGVSACPSGIMYISFINRRTIIQLLLRGKSDYNAGWKPML